jgi:cytochrome c oxidase assembly protein subunit 15
MSGSSPGSVARNAVPLGFAAAVSMWAVAYVGRLPLVMAPSWAVGLAMLVAVALWGYLAGRWTGQGLRMGVAAGFVAALVNMLILGSLLSSVEEVGVHPSALWWVPGSLLATAGLAGLAAMAAPRDGALSTDGGTALLTRTGVAATFLLVVAGGLVTSYEAGLAVVDWPNSFGYNMFLYPLSRMTGGIYYEHAHRLFGSLVGLATLVVAWRIWRTDARRWVKHLSLAAVVLVITQGIMGGLRVTGRLTMSQAPEDMAPNLFLAAAHGVLGQVFLGLMVVLAVITSLRWRTSGDALGVKAAGTERTLQHWLVGTLLVQLVLGAVQRHFAQGLVVHISMAAVVAMLAWVAGARAWALYPRARPVHWFGRAVVIVVSVQLVLGVAALAVTMGEAVSGDPGSWEVAFATAHQATGALLLACSVALATWTRRLV